MLTDDEDRCPFCDYDNGEPCKECLKAMADKYADERIQDRLEGK